MDINNTEESKLKLARSIVRDYNYLEDLIEKRIKLNRTICDLESNIGEYSGTRFEYMIIKGRDIWQDDYEEYEVPTVEFVELLKARLRDINSKVTEIEEYIENIKITI